jgi:hypothetical protein
MTVSDQTLRPEGKIIEKRTVQMIWRDVIMVWGIKSVLSQQDVMKLVQIAIQNSQHPYKEQTARLQSMLVSLQTDWFALLLLFITLYQQTDRAGLVASA